MSAPEPTAVERTIAEAIAESLAMHDWDDDHQACGCGVRFYRGRYFADHQSEHVAQAVVSAIRNLPPAEMAELLGGEVERQEIANGLWRSDCERVVGPWREVRDV